MLSFNDIKLAFPKMVGGVFPESVVVSCDDTTYVGAYILYSGEGDVLGRRVGTIHDLG
jgi:hypothetical protein